MNQATAEFGILNVTQAAESQTLQFGFGEPGMNPRVLEPERCCRGNARKIEDSIAYMKQHLSEPLRVSTLASVAGMSEPHYFALFKRHIGFTPLDYFIRLRMHCACRLLATTVLSVKEVAAALGYDDPFYFSRIFKSVNEVAPTQYRSAVATSVRESRRLLSPSLSSILNGGEGS